MDKYKNISLDKLTKVNTHSKDLFTRVDGDFTSVFFTSVVWCGVYNLFY